MEEAPGTQPHYEPAAKSYSEFPLSPVMQEALEKAGYTNATEIQAGLIPLALEGKDVVGQARTGTGKTASFVIPILERLKPRKEVHGPQALIMVPTRELAVQVRGEVVKLAEGRRMNCVALYGGMPLKEQIDKLRRGADVIVGTPGRVIDLHWSRRPRPQPSHFSSCSTKPIACSISAFGPISRRFCGVAPTSGKRCCFRPPCRRRS